MRAGSARAPHEIGVLICFIFWNETRFRVSGYLYRSTGMFLLEINGCTKLDVHVRRREGEIRVIETFQPVVSDRCVVLSVLHRFSTREFIGNGIILTGLLRRFINGGVSFYKNEIFYIKSECS